MNSFVTWEYQNGTAIGKLEDIVDKKGKIEVWRNGKPSGDRVIIPKELLSKVNDDYWNIPPTEPVEEKLEELEREPKTDPGFHPTKRQMELISSLSVPHLGEVSADELAVVSFIAADNLMNRSASKWDLTALKKIPNMLKKGLPLMLNHDWDNISSIAGIIFDGKTVRSANTDGRELNRIISLSGAEQFNREIILNEGYWTAQVSAAIPLNTFDYVQKTYVENPILRGIRLGYYRFVSCGFHMYELHCPLCNTSFMDRKCPHVPPSTIGETDPDGIIAPYAIRKKLTDMGELSLVTIPNLPGAEVIR